MKILEGNEGTISCFIRPHGGYIRVHFHNGEMTYDFDLDSHEASQLSKLLHKLSEQVSLTRSELPE